MKIRIALASAFLGVIATAATASAQVQLTMHDGHVTLSAKNATIQQILSEWERVGETRVVNGDRLPGGLVTLELPNMPEQQALDIILRSVSGVLFAPRREAAAGNVSAFAQIVLMPPSIAPPPPPPSASASVPPPFGQQTTYPQQLPFQQPQYQQQPPVFQQPVITDDDDRPTVAQPRPVFVFPQPQITNPQAMPPGGAMPPQQVPQLTFPQQGIATSPPPATFPGAIATPGGVSVPGMVVPAPMPQPGQPGFVPPPQVQPQPAPQRTNP
ncbi:MAG: hypothetical protein ABI868_14335 [Acidobacteriota bacterium]